MDPDHIKGEVAAIARRAMDVALSHIHVAVGDTLVLPVSLTGIQLPRDMADLVRSVADSTGFITRYSEGSLVLSWTNAGTTKFKSSDTTLEDIHEVLKEILALQVRAAQRNDTWSRQDIMTALALLLAFVVAVLGQIESFVNAPPSVGVHGSTAVQTHPTPAPSSDTHLRPAPSNTSESPTPRREGPFDVNIQVRLAWRLVGWLIVVWPGATRPDAAVRALRARMC